MFAFISIFSIDIMPIKNLINIYPTYAGIRHNVKVQKRFLQDIVEPDIANALNTNDGSLDEEDFRKIRGYYGFGVPAIVGEGFCTLRQSPMTDNERKCATYQGALTGLYDDFFDKTNMSLEDIRSMMDNPESYLPKSSLEKLFIHFLRQVRSRLPDKSIFNKAFDQVFEAQKQSSGQTTKEISFEDIKEITIKKGGYSLLFYRTAFGGELLEGEQKALYNIGGAMQLGNDIFDVYEDEKEGIQTLLTACTHIEEPRSIFTEQLKESVRLIKDSAYSPSGIKNYLRKYILGMSRCFVALDQFERLEKRSGGIFKASEYLRKDLICDMEKPGNIISSLRYYLGYKF